MENNSINAQPAGPASAPNPSPVRPAKPKNNKVLYLIIALLAIALVGMSIYAFYPKSSGTNQNTNTTDTTNSKTGMDTVKNKDPKINNDAKTDLAKMVCAKHSKICFNIPADWKSKLTITKDESHKKQDKSLKGHVNIENLKISDENGQERFTLNNRYASPDFNGAYGVGGACVGKINRTVINYKKLNLQISQPNFENKYALQSVVDTIDPANIDGETGPVKYEAYIELGYEDSKANKIGTFSDVDCNVLVLRGLMSGLTQDFDYITLTTNIKKEFPSKEAAIAELKKPENKKTFEVMSTFYQK